MSKPTRMRRTFGALLLSIGLFGFASYPVSAAECQSAPIVVVADRGTLRISDSELAFNQALLEFCPGFPASPKRVPVSNSWQLSGVTIGPTGDVYVTTMSSFTNQVTPTYVVTTSGNVVATLEVSENTGNVVFDAMGHAYIASPHYSRGWDDGTIIEVGGPAFSVIDRINVPMGFGTMAISRAGRLFISTSDGGIAVVDTTRGVVLPGIVAGASAIAALTSGDDGRIYVEYFDGTTRIYDPLTLQPLEVLRSPRHRVLGKRNSIAVAQDGTVVISDRAANIAEIYSKGSTSPTNTISIPRMKMTRLDREGRLYALVVNERHYEIDVYNTKTSEIGSRYVTGITDPVDFAVAQGS